MIGGRVQLLDAAAATGAGDLWAGGRAAWLVWGTWDGATAKLQMTPDQGTTWIDVDGATATVDGGGPFDLPPLKHRVVISGAGVSTSLSSALFGMQ
jgi:hypothetical protein